MGKEEVGEDGIAITTEGSLFSPPPTTVHGDGGGKTGRSRWEKGGTFAGFYTGHVHFFHLFFLFNLLQDNYKQLITVIFDI